mmetsp:Transcript_41538/g.93709  ORF Transcript_41538/g.93709 Transcript_41538/m.93709 type:complete len:227 (+) Transcript_41538:156-836(+)
MDEATKCRNPLAQVASPSQSLEDLPLLCLVAERFVDAVGLCTPLLLVGPQAAHGRVRRHPAAADEEYQENACTVYGKVHLRQLAADVADAIEAAGPLHREAGVAVHEKSQSKRLFCGVAERGPDDVAEVHDLIVRGPAGSRALRHPGAFKLVLTKLADPVQFVYGKGELLLLQVGCRHQAVGMPTRRRVEAEDEEPYDARHGAAVAEAVHAVASGPQALKADEVVL